MPTHCASLPDRRCLVSLCAPTSTRSAPGCAKAGPTPGSPTSSRSACATSNSSSAQNELVEERTPARAAQARRVPDEIDLRAEDDALIAADWRQPKPRPSERRPRRRRRPNRRARPARTTTRTRRRPRGRGAGVAAAGAACSDRAPQALRQSRSRAPSITARRATVCGSTRRSRTTRSTPSTGPGIARSRSQSRRLHRHSPLRHRRLVTRRRRSAARS